MREEQRKKRQQLMMEFRYAVVAELANPYLDHGQLKELIREKARREYEIPFSKRTTISEACIKQWLSKYRRYGRQGLMPKSREDIGRSRVLPEQEVVVLTEYLLEHPKLTATAAYKKLYAEGKIRTELSSSTLSRIIQSHGLTREERSRKKAEQKTLKFEFFYPLECVQADCMHGPAIPDGNGKRRKAILLTLLDDATRRIVYARFSFTEESLVFEEGIKHVLKSHGKIGRVYVDNGSTFVSSQTARILDILEVLLVHSKPGRPQGRGKQERYYRTVREGFLRPLDIEAVKSIDELNTRFRTWLESEYHRSPHRGLNGRTPLEVWLEKAKHLRPVSPTVDLDEVFFHQVTRKVFKDSTVTLHGTLYEVPSVLIGKRIILRYDPFGRTPCLRLSCDGNDYGEAKPVDGYANTRVSRNDNRSGALEDCSRDGEGNVAATLTASANIYHKGAQHET
jgi:transposase InsO family protein